MARFRVVFQKVLFIRADTADRAMDAALYLVKHNRIEETIHAEKSPKDCESFHCDNDGVQLVN